MNEVRDIQWAEFGVTNVHPFSIVFMIVMIACALAPRRSAVLFGVLAVCVFMQAEQRVVIGALDFNMLRLFMLVAWIRVFVKGEHRSLHFGKLDRLLVLWTLSSAVVQILRVGPSTIAYCLGVVFDALTAYFLNRLWEYGSDRRTRWLVATACMSVVIAASLPRVLAQYQDGGRLDFRAAARHVESHWSPVDRVLSDQPTLFSHYLPPATVEPFSTRR